MLQMNEKNEKVKCLNKQVYQGIPQKLKKKEKLVVWFAASQEQKTLQGKIEFSVVKKLGPHSGTEEKSKASLHKKKKTNKKTCYEQKRT